MFRSVVLGRLLARMLPLLAADVIQKKDSEFFGWHRETHPYYNLTVKILRARNIHGLDLLSKADCYVALKLPTASPLIKRTQVVYNSSDPEWNETFEYRIHSAVKNILELTFYNRDIVLSSLSNHATSIAFDTGNITPGEILNHTFVLNSQAPVVAVAASGGGMRRMTGCMATCLACSSLPLRYPDISVASQDLPEWCEYTPYEFGFHKYGAFIRTEDYSSRFFMGLLLERHQEPRICFLQGIWGSAFAGNIEDIWKDTMESVKGAIKIVDELLGSQSLDSSPRQAQVIMPGGAFTQLFYNLFKSRITTGENFNFLHGLYLHKDYVNDKEFVAWKETHLDAVPNQLTPGKSSLHLVDGGVVINSPFPVILQPERDVDIIFSFNYSWQSPFEILHQTQSYCEERGIPFPHIAVSDNDKQNPKECYMFLNADDPKAPIVLHFPLVNKTFKKYKAPGVKRDTEEEKSFADFHIYTEDGPYGYTKFTYQPIDFDRLLQLSCYNVINNKDAILKALHLAMKRRKFKKTKQK
ncbi:cytosolic phospholipase A2 zeta-like [Sceloporus undulatus]|uniref:cytosolic phospholipase A2 zeta-like n=1 Tax=Sceloporus undulatus TaxID=8520 RepID=UPI001C4D1740|nr:cytosolic phospholipase A2 zeta-like [Sceloporus undulatus]